MTQEIMWSLLVAMAAIAIACVLDSVKHRRELHLANKEISSAREKLNSLEQDHEQTITNLEELHSTEKEKLLNRISEIEHVIKTHRPHAETPRGSSNW